MKRKVWLLLAVVPVLLAAYAVKRSLVPAPVSGGASVDRRPAHAPPSSRELRAVAPSRSMPHKPATVPTLPGNLDPFVVLDEQYEARQVAQTAWFDEAEGRIRARIQPALDASVANHKRDVEDLDGKNLNMDQKTQWNKQLNVQYEKARLGIKRTIQPDLDKLTAERREALEKLESDRAEKRTRLQEIQALAEKGQIDPIAAKRAQFEILGISLPPSAFPSSPERQEQTDTKTAPPRQGTPTVQAIVATADNRFCALIEGALVSQGDTVHGYCVRKIRTDRVEFEKDGKTWVQRAD